LEIYTIGFTGRTASSFFESLLQHRISRLVDVRLHNTSQLAGYSKRDDLAYFLDRIAGAQYAHRVDLAPTAELLAAYRAHQLTWASYETSFLALLQERRVERLVDIQAWTSVPTALLCSEPTATRCHRRLVVEYLQQVVAPTLQVVHL
jgi:uncharacterized protein (DUF488 family)